MGRDDWSVACFPRGSVMHSTTAHSTLVRHASPPPPCHLTRAERGGGVTQTKADEIGLNRVVGCEMQMRKCLTHPALLESVPRKFLVLCATSHHGRSRN